MNESIREALGISVGDFVWTSYGQPQDYEVTSISAPQHWFEAGGEITIYSAPVISLVCRDRNRDTRTPSYLNDIRRVEDRWFSEMNDEVFVQKKESKEVYQPDLFSALKVTDSPAAYPFQPGIDYLKGNRQNLAL